jgi:putative ABC transport system ATP-binding protein
VAQNVLFVMTIAAVLIGLFGSGDQIIREEPIYRRERLANLGIIPYVGARMVLMLVASAAGIVLLFVGAWLPLDQLTSWPPLGGLFRGVELGVLSGVELPTQGVQWQWWGAGEVFVTLFLATLANATLGLWVSAMVPRRDTVPYVVMFLVFVQIVFAGVILPLPDIDVLERVSWGTLSRSTLEALGSIVNVPDMGELPPPRVDYDAMPDHVWARWSILLKLIGIFGLGTWASLAAKEWR